MSRPKSKNQSKKRTSAFRHIGCLPTIAEELEAIAKATSNQIKVLERSLDAQQVFYDHLLNHLIQVYGKAMEYCALYRDQFDLWLSQDLDPDERSELERLIELNQRVRAGNERVLDLCNKTRWRVSGQDDQFSMDFTVSLFSPFH